MPASAPSPASCDWSTAWKASACGRALAGGSGLYGHVGGDGPVGHGGPLGLPGPLGPLGLLGLILAVIRCFGRRVGVGSGRDHRLAQSLPSYRSVLAEFADPGTHPELAAVRERLRGWRFYDGFRVDAAAPARRERRACSQRRTTALLSMPSLISLSATRRVTGSCCSAR